MDMTFQQEQYTLIEKKKFEKRQIILFITANDHERDALLDRLQPYKPNKLEKYIGNNTSYVLGRLGKYAVAHVHCSDQGSSKPDASINTIKEALQDIRPKMIVMVGICFGIDADKQRIGDVLTSTAIYPYEYFKVTSQGMIDRNKVFYPSRKIRNLFENYIAREASYRKYSGVLISGEKLIDRDTFKDKLIESLHQVSDTSIIGGEMEGAGLASVAYREGFSDWIVVKAICDFGSNKEEGKEERQEIAAKNAVHYCEDLFETDYIFDAFKIKKLKLSPNFEETVSINKYEMFFYRQARRKGFEALAKACSLDKELLRGLEREGAPMKIKRSEAEKLRKALGCGAELYGDRSNLLHKSFYERNKNKHAFFPTVAPKAVVFDFDGTFCIDKETTWQLIWKRLGYDSYEADALHRKFSNEEITHAEWCATTEKMFLAKHLTKDIVESVADSLTLIGDLREVLYYLNQRGVELFICSGSINTIIDRVLGDQKHIFKFISCNEFQYDSSGSFTGIIETRFDFKGKKDFITQYVLPTIKSDECLYIGNSNNDECVTQSGISTLVVNPAMTDTYRRSIWTYYLGPINSLKLIYPFVFPFG